MSWTLIAILVVGVAYLAITRVLRPIAEMSKVIEQAERTSQAREQLAEYLVAMLQQRPHAARTARKRLCQLHPAALAFTRSLELVVESLAIIEKTKNLETLQSRREVALVGVQRAHEDAADVFDVEQRDKLSQLVTMTASERLASLHILKIEALQQKAADAKTEATRTKRLAEVQQLATAAALGPHLDPADAQRILAAATKS